MTDTQLAGAIEAVLMVADDPVSPADLAAAIEVPEQDVLATIEALRDEYADPDRPRGFELREKGRQHAATFSWSRTAKLTHELYRRLAR